MDAKSKEWITATHVVGVKSVGRNRKKENPTCCYSLNSVVKKLRIYQSCVGENFYCMCTVFISTFRPIPHRQPHIYFPNTLIIILTLYYLTTNSSLQVQLSFHSLPQHLLIITSISRANKIMVQSKKFRGVRQRQWGSWVSEIRHPLL